MHLDLNALTVFAVVAETRSFRAAADRLGVTRSAVSQTMRKLETQLGIALLQRTTRSVSLTEAGARFQAGIAGALAEIGQAAEAAAALRGHPSGLLRLAVSSIAESFLSGPQLGAFLEAHPGIRLDVTVTDAEFDIVAEGFDAGVRLGEVIAQDMIAVPVSAPQRQLAVAAPSYLARHGRPAHPRELPAHRCIGWRPAPELPPYRWEFGADGAEFDVEVAPHVTTNDMALMIRLACAGHGITFGMEESFRPWIGRGELVPLLEDYCPPFPGFFLYFPSRRHLAPKLRALIDHLRRGGRG
ncbi:LysR family transcriptional regulator [Teichococcus cervicalis]|uniref:LysR substrate binding domain protein n=1 Tax=Pseudoroseomonas cervicalis ATCC 49957 TaxID=525371 RepID=D5RG70_9PROT|nr:LysR family transcriptional regulator [Pseudoroseomonas cervicalis]EFH13696.1 LysR substrate binding domain protein [Pseudoroseomonas cervicalis ATCC 49957]